jgi:hypothetical protein
MHTSLPYGYYKLQDLIQISLPLFKNPPLSAISIWLPATHGVVTPHNVIIQPWQMKT